MRNLLIKIHFSIRSSVSLIENTIRVASGRIEKILPLGVPYFQKGSCLYWPTLYEQMTCQIIEIYLDACSFWIISYIITISQKSYDYTVFKNYACRFIIEHLNSNVWKFKVDIFIFWCIFSCCINELLPHKNYHL